MKMGLRSSTVILLSMISSSSSLPLTSPSKFKLPLRILNSHFSFSSLTTKSTTRFPLPHDDDDDLSDPLPPPNFHNDKDKPSNAIDRILLRFRNLASLPSDDDDEPTLTADNFLRREWVRPDETVFPWEKEEQQHQEEDQGLMMTKKQKKKKEKEVKAPFLAEDELRRLRTLGMHLKDRVSVPKAGLTRAVLQKIHHHWKNNELVRLKFHELLAQNMNLAHHIVERRTGGLVVWRSGSVMWVYRGKNYQPPTANTQQNSKGGYEKSESVLWNQQQPENTTAEEVEFNRMLDDFGPRFVDWWGTGILPVDADLLPPTVPGYKIPLRLLPAGVRSRLTNGELTNMRKLAKALPCHFALGRNRNLQGLACAILKLWEKSLVAKIAVKRGIQNTNNELMGQELKKLTGGTLLLRNKFYIVIYRGKDFVPTSVAAVLAERQELKKQVQDVEEKMQCRAVDVIPSGEDETTAQAGSLAEFYEAKAQWGRDISTEEHGKMMNKASKAKNVRLIKKIERKLAVAPSKRIRAEKLLAKIEASMVPAGPDNDRETITDEERIMLRAVGLRMKAYLQLGTLGVFDGVIENMHLHWRHRELVKLITKQKTLAFVEDRARLLEYESGGILVAIDRLPKGFSLIYYRGKNYRRPITLRPRNLLTKAKALQCSIAMQRPEALSQHITELGGKIGEMKKELGASKDLETEDRWSAEDHNQIDHITEFTQSDGEGFDGDDNDGDFDDTEDGDCDDEDSEFSNLENDGFPVKAG